MSRSTVRHCIRRTTLPLLMAAASSAFIAPPALAGQLTYTPVNPSFGGSPLNGSFLLQSAQTQKRYPYPTEDLGFDEIGQIIQTNNGFLIQKGNQLYWVDNNGNAHPVNLSNSSNP
ncbi:curli assembly protein CsgF [Castellaniella sp.]|uniref:curli assembly protein CsgF n=1 Tax=Castellaniella sp. TaxID=1955812 RepID=UPI002AFF6417|nr:curli assembly protein CsgF [Castellaniella sp.]